MVARTILVVEDDPNDENLTLRALRQSGAPCSVVVTRTSSEAIDFLLKRGPFSGRASGDPYVVFMDNTLPGAGGSDLVALIRKHDHLRGVPIVILSGTSDESVIERCAKAGANSFLEKPIDMLEYMRYVGAAAKYWLDLNISPEANRAVGFSI